MAKPAIGVYRMTRYPDHDKIIFQGNEEAESLFRNTFPLRVTEAKEGFEGGFYTWLRSEAREGLYNHVQRFFRQHYVPPRIEVGIFIGKKPLSSEWPTRVWIGKLVDGVKYAFDDYLSLEPAGRWLLAGM